MNTRAKGERVKQLCTKYLIKQGYYVHNNPHLRFGSYSNYNNKVNKDMFGLFDGIAVHSHMPKVYFLQYSANKFHAIKPYIEWVKKTGTTVCLLCIKDRDRNVYIKKIYFEKYMVKSYVYKCDTDGFVIL